jgi:heat shock protein HtpX
MPANVLEQQASNRRRTWMVMVLFAGFLFVLGYGVDRFYFEIPFPATAAVALAIGTASSVNGFFRGDRAVLASATAVPCEELDRDDASPEFRLKLQQFSNVVDEMCLASGLPRPRLYVVPDPDPNAFATGRDPARASIAVTRGLLEALSRDELQGVVAHELSHVRNYDTRLMTVIAALVGAVALVSDWALRLSGGGRSGRGSGDKKSGGGAAGFLVFVVWFAAILLAPLVGQLLAMLVSREREYLADASAAELTRNPLGLAGALAKVDAAAGPTRAIKRGSANLCIVDPLARPIGRRQGRWADLLASHPPLEKRVAALRGMAYV